MSGTAAPDRAGAGLALRSGAGRVALTAAIGASAMAMLDATVVNVALPHIGEDFGVGVADLQWVAVPGSATRVVFHTVGLQLPFFAVPSTDSNLDMVLCLSSLYLASPPLPIVGQGTTKCRKLTSDLEMLTFGSLPAAAGPGVPNDYVAATSVAFAKAAGFHGYVVHDVTNDKLLIVFTEATVDAGMLTTRGLALPIGHYEWQTFTIDMATSADTFASSDITFANLVARGGEYTLSAIQDFHLN